MKHPAAHAREVVPQARRALSWVGLLLTGLVLSACDGAPSDPHAGHDDHGPPGASSNEVTLSELQIKGAGIRIEPVGPATISERLRLTAVVQENLDTQAHLTPKVPGLVRSVRKGLGDSVEAGEILCELESTVLGEAASTYMEGQATLEAVRRSLRQETAFLTSSVQVAKTIYDRQRRLKDQQITTLGAFYQAEKAYADARLNRDSRVLQLTSDLRQREIRLHTAEERLRILGLSADDLADLAKDEDGDHAHGRYPLRAPRAGVIVARDATENEYVDTSSKLFLIQDLRQVWVMASVYERDLRRVTRGQIALVKLEAFPGITLRGKVTFLDYHVDPTSRACQVRVELPNEAIPGWKEPYPLRPGLFGSVELIVREQQAALAIPEEALVHEGERSYVFLALGPASAKADDHDDHDPDEKSADHADHDPDEKSDDHDEKSDDHDDHDEKSAGHDEKSDDHDHDEKSADHDDKPGADDHDDSPRQRFVRRLVKIGARGATHVEVLSGLKPGDRVVVAGTFTLKSAARQGELGGGHSH